MGRRGIRRLLTGAFASVALLVVVPAAGAVTITVPCSGGTPALVAAVNTANGTPAADTIDITGGPCTFTLTAAADAVAGSNGLPTVVQPLTILGHGSTITRSPSAGAFRILLANGVSSSLALNGLTISNGLLNGANVGAGIAGVNAVISLDGVTVNGNQTSLASGANGGGIWVQGGSLTVDHSTISNNLANAAGGIYSLAAPVIVRHSLLYLNGAFSIGAAWINATTATFENDTFAIDYANNGIGGITASNLNTTNAVVNISSSTFADSSVTNSVAPANSLLAFRNGATGTMAFNVSQTVITDTDSAAAAAVAACGTIVGGTITDSGGSMDFPGSSCPFTTHADAKLAALANNGGLSQTYRPLPTSPAIDAGGATCVATDQRDKPRPVFAACDSGAFEVQAPETTTVSGPSGITNSTATTFTGVTDGATTFQCRTDGGSYSGCSSPFTPVLSDGAHTIDVRATDTYGHVDATPISFSFTQDKVNPAVTITNPPPAVATVNSFSLDFTVTDVSATSTTCKIDAGAAVPCTTPFATGTLADGTHTVLITATDAATNSGSASTTFKVDTAASQSITPTCTVASLIAAVTSANATIAADTISLPAACTYTLTASVDATAGGNGLPIVIHPLRINGNGSTISRSTVSGTPAFRVLNAINSVDAANSLELHDLTITGGAVVGSGAGVSATGTAVVMDGVSIASNLSTSSGGGVATTGGSLDIDHSSIFFNQSATAAGMVTVSTPTTVRRSLLYSNVASGSIGAAYVLGGTATFENDTFGVNFAANGIAGVTVANNAAVSGVGNVVSSTFVDSTKTSSTTPANSLLTFLPGGSGTATIHVSDTIIADTDSTTATAAADFKPCDTSIGAPGSIIDDGGNLEYGGPAANTCNFGTHGVSPLLTAIAANGGPTLNYLPGPGSPAIDLGGATCPATDQRNITRPDGDGCDTGSDETPAPETIATGPAPSPTSTTTTTFSSPDAPAATFQCKVDGAATFTACSSPFSPVLGDGAHTIAVRAVIASGYVDPSPAVVAFTVDKTAPVVAISNKPPAVTPNNSPSLDFIVDDGSATVSCKLDAAAPVPCSTPYVPGTLADGPHTIVVSAKDAAGNVGSDSAAFTVDTVPPQTINVSTCGDVAALRAAITLANSTLAPDVIELPAGPCTFTLNDSVDNTAGGNGLPLVIHPLTINGHGSTITRNTASGTPNFRILFALNSVDTAVSLTLNDLTVAGGVVASPNVGAGIAGLGAVVTIDHGVIIGNFAGNAGGGIFTSGGSLSIDHTTIQQNFANIAAGIETSLSPTTVRRSTFVLNQANNTGAAAIAATTATFENDTFAANIGANGLAGITVVNSGATSGSANVASSTFADSSATTTAPSGALATSQTAGGGTASIHVTDTIVTDTDSLAAPTSLKPCDSSLGGTITDDGGNLEYPGNTCNFGTQANPQLTAFALNGGTTGTYRPSPTSPAIDLGGATCPATDQRDVPRPDGEACDTGSVETNAPNTTLTGPASDPTNTPTVTMTSDQTAQTFQCKVDAGAFAACTSPFTVPLAAGDGPHTVTVRAIDPQGYFDQTPESVTFTVDRTKPVVTITNKPAAITSDNAPSLNFTVDDNSATVTCVLDGAPAVPCSTPYAPGTLADGTHTITISATDPVGNVGSDSTTFKVDTVPAQTISVPCSDVTALRAAITAANATLAADVIDITGGPCTFTLNDSVDPIAGGNGLPVVIHPLTIDGHGSTIARNTASGTPAFRVLLATNAVDPANALTLHDLTISGGAVVAPNVGGGLATLGVAVTIDHAVFLGNFAGAAGGGIWTSGGSLDVDHSTFQQNFAVTAAGLETNITPTTVRRSAFVLNQANNTGGAVVVGGNAVFENDTFGGNIGSNGIGSLAVVNSGATNGAASVASSTFTDSTATTTAPAGALVTGQAAGGGTASITVKNTIVTDTDSTVAPTSIKPCDTSLGGTITDAGGNLEYPGTTCAGFGTHANPQLAAFALNGGTTGSYRLLPGSPAIDLGGSICPATDQRDFARPDGLACDSGAYETDTPQTTASGPAAPTSAPVITFSSDHPGSTFQCRVDGGAFAACSSPYTPVFPTNGSADGSHTVDVRATDSLGYVDPSPASVTFTYFSVPDTAITAGPTGGATIYDPVANYAFTSTKTPALFECSFDAAPFTNCTSPKSYTGLTEGTHTFAVRAKDAAGHVDPTPATATFKYHHCLLLKITLNGTVICLI